MRMSGVLVDDATRTQVTDLLRGGGLSSLLQPIWDLESDRVVGYEALVRGSGELTSPAALFEAATRSGLQAELELECLAAAFRAADRHDLRGVSLFLNVEPSLMTDGTARTMQALAVASGSTAHVVLEITERALTSRPAELLRTVASARRLGWSIALDDVGAEPASLTFMELLRPDVVKLDMSLLRLRPNQHVAEVVSAVSAYAERTGAMILAEGIEDVRQLELARSMGARLGQGYLLGRPADHLAPAAGDDLLARTRVLPAASPWPGRTREEQARPTALLEGLTVRRSPKRLLVELSKHLEREAIRLGPTAVMISTFQSGDHLTPATLERYGRITRSVGFTCVLGADLARDAVPGALAVDLEADDPLCLEWDVVVMSPHFSGALIARDLLSSGPDCERMFEYAVTYDRATVCAAADAILRRT